MTSFINYNFYRLFLIEIINNDNSQKHWIFSDYGNYRKYTPSQVMSDDYFKACTEYSVNLV